MVVGWKRLHKASWQLACVVQIKPPTFQTQPNCPGHRGGQGGERGRAWWAAGRPGLRRHRGDRGGLLHRQRDRCELCFLHPFACAGNTACMRSPGLACALHALQAAMQLSPMHLHATPATPCPPNAAQRDGPEKSKAAARHVCARVWSPEISQWEVDHQQLQRARRA